MNYKQNSYLKKQNGFLKYLLMLIKSIFYSLLITVAFALIIGFRPVIVVGGSMEPTFKRGDVILIKKIPQEQIKVGDILTYQLSKNDKYCTHRIIEIDENGNFKTQGDANDSPDPAIVKYNNVIGITYYKFHYIPVFFEWLFVITNLISFISAIIILYFANKESKYIWHNLINYL
ncbi:MAG: signal peptidase I [Clostridia bacterium]|nr:signal peptidase I [Clostridia bacterium]